MGREREYYLYNRKFFSHMCTSARLFIHKQAETATKTNPIINPLTRDVHVSSSPSISSISSRFVGWLDGCVTVGGTMRRGSLKLAELTSPDTPLDCRS